MTAASRGRAPGSWRWFVLLAGVLAAALATANANAPHRALAEAVALTVTSTSGTATAGDACPDDARCTLRKAIETANATPGSDPVTITFNASAFPASSPATIALSGKPLPAITRANVTVDGSGAGVAIDGSGLAGEAAGLVLDGDSSTVRGLEIRGFGGACLTLGGAHSHAGGDPASGTGNWLGDCGTGIEVRGAATTLQGNVAGSGRTAATPRPVDTGIHVMASDVTVGGAGIEPALANIVGNATVGIRVGGTSGPAITGVVIARNRIGTNAEDGPAPVERGVLVTVPAQGTHTAANTFRAITRSAVAVGEGSTGNTVSGNVYQSMAGLAVDLGDDGAADANDPGDGDGGANTRLNSPELTWPIQAALTGSACAGCLIEFYRVAHSPGSAGDHPTTPFATVQSDAAGGFNLTSPPVSPGEWIAATATDASGNTSEFSHPVRVGVGAILCGNLALKAGWNQAGYFGPGTAILGDWFPGDTQRLIRAVYYREANGSYSHWFRDTATGRTLTAVEPGRSYWFLVDAPLTLSSGFSLTAPLGIQLHAGWNDFVYFGASASGMDAFASLEGTGATVYRFDPGDGGKWQRWGTTGTPAYAREFDAVTACESYTVYIGVSAVLRPLHP